MEYNVARQFSRTPSARVFEEGKFPGAELRQIIAPLIKECIDKKESFIINLDGASGYGTSFLEEVFGGLIRNEEINYQDLKSVLHFITKEEPELEAEIWEYIDDANNDKR